MEKIVVILCAQRKNGTSIQIQKYLEQKNKEISFITLYDKDVQPCCHCMRCSVIGKCSKYKDNFYQIVCEVEQATTIIVISPLYTMIPSKITAFFERLSNITYLAKHECILKNKKIGVIGYDSKGISYRLIELLKEIMLPIANSFRDNEKFDFLIHHKQQEQQYKNIFEMLDDILEEV